MKRKEIFYSQVQKLAILRHHLLQHPSDVNRNYNKFDLATCQLTNERQKKKEFYKFILHKVKTRIILFYSKRTSISSFVNENHPWAIRSGSVETLTFPSFITP